jgi:predicted nucleic acid-binding protein
VTDFVLDSSITFSWFFEDERTAAAIRLLDRLETETAAVPSLWYIEIANVLAVRERQKRTTAAHVAEFVAQLGALTIVADEEAPAQSFGRVLDLARSERLTGYDAAYLELSMRLGVPLATKDRQLGEAAERLGVQVLWAM